MATIELTDKSFAATVERGPRRFVIKVFTGLLPGSDKGGKRGSIRVRLECHDNPVFPEVLYEPERVNRLPGCLPHMVERIVETYRAVPGVAGEVA